MPSSTLELIALALGLGWASGLRLYATVATIGALGALNYIALPAGLDVLAHPWVIGVATIMFAVEFLADKIPGVDSFWDAVQTFVRIPAGALLAYAATTEVEPALQVIAALLGGSLAAGTHLAKAGARALINTSPEPFTNWGASIGEDALVFAGLALCLQHPVLFLCALTLFAALLLWALPKLMRGIAALFVRIAAIAAGARTDGN